MAAKGDSRAITISIYALSSITGITYIEAKLCGKLRRTRSNNFNARQVQKSQSERQLNHFSENKQHRLRRHKSSKNGVLQVRLAPRHARALESRCHVCGMGCQIAKKPGSKSRESA